MGVTATDELRRLLDERGVEWIHGRLSSESTAWLDGNVAVVADEYGDGLLLVERKMTPEQAIEATLGRGTCRNISPKLGNGEFTCEECLARVYGSGGEWFDVNWEYHAFNYCPNCGRKVVD